MARSLLVEGDGKGRSLCITVNGGDRTVHVLLKVFLYINGFGTNSQELEQTCLEEKIVVFTDVSFLLNTHLFLGNILIDFDVLYFINLSHSRI